MSHGNGFFAWGFGGQFVFVVPARSLVVVVTTEWRNAGALAPQLEFNGLDLIVNHILPAVR
jgi:CubicO group peptidase (beta-lactamase class C family)